jgi:hypothetical protein
VAAAIRGVAAAIPYSVAVVALGTGTAASRDDRGVSELILMSDPRVAAVSMRECGERLVDVRQGGQLLVDLRKQDDSGCYGPKGIDDINEGQG